MFTGIIQGVGEIAELVASGDVLRVHVATGALNADLLERGESIAVNGVCLTAAEPSQMGFWADISAETRACTTLATLERGAAVNLERALQPTTRIGGHLVSGHVDGIGQVLSRWDDGECVLLVVRAPQQLSRYLAAKGSICVDGVSLTINRVEDGSFGFTLVPHTLRATTLGALRAGRTVNLEVDLIARYVERLLTTGQEAATAPATAITRELLFRCGFDELGPDQGGGRRL